MKKDRSILFTFFFVFLLSMPLLAAEPIIINNIKTRISIVNDLEYIKDIDKNLTIDKITDKSLIWKHSNKEELNFGLRSTPYWFRFTVNNISKQETNWYLEIAFAMLDYIDLYIPQETGGFKVIRTGDGTPFNTRDVKDREFIFYLKERPGQHTYYIRVFCPISSTTIPLSILSHDGFINRYNVELPIFWMYFGLLLLIIIYNIFIFTQLKEETYLYYILFVCLYTLSELRLKGFDFQYLWPNSIWWSSISLPVFMCLLVISICLFCRSYLKTKTEFPIFDKLILYTLLIPSSIIFVLSFFINGRDSLNLATVVILVMPVLLFVLSIYATIKGSKPARFFLYAFSSFLLGIFLYVMKSIGFIPANFITIWSSMLGSALMVVIFTVGLTDKINSMKKELQELNVDLEKKVNERTCELTMTMDTMQRINKELAEARDSIWGEMQLAKKIQTILLPDNPSIKGYDISAQMITADEVGGDYYDIINANDSDWILIGDVSGHGVSAGLIMMMVQTCIQIMLKISPDIKPSSLITSINRTVSNNIGKLGEDKYMTLTAVVSSGNSELNFSGLHQDIMIYRAKSEDIEIIETNGIWIGISDNIEGLLEDQKITLDKDDSILLFTDGITEALDKSDNLFSNERLQNTFKKLGKKSADEIKDGILNELNDYECNDDVSLVVMKRILI